MFLIKKFSSPFHLGYNVSILTYGQTGSGKSYTLGTSIPIQEQKEKEQQKEQQGEQQQQQPQREHDEDDGIIPRSMNTLFTLINSLEKYKSTKVTFTVSYLEIINDDLVDLLIDNDLPQPSAHHHLQHSHHDELLHCKPVVFIRDDMKGKNSISGLQEFTVDNVEEVIE